MLEGRKPDRKKSLACCTIVTTVCLFVGGLCGIAAYMSDRDKGLNTFTVGNVKIEAAEPGFPTDDSDNNGIPDECELMVPYKTVTKDPRIRNIGKNDAVVFLRITAPAEELSLILDDGTRQGASMSDLFWFKQKEDRDELHSNNFNPDWIRLPSLDGDLVDCPGINNEGRGLTYIFGYHMRLRPGEWTKTLFDKVQNKKYGSKTISPDETEVIRIESFAVQADDIIKSGSGVQTDGEISEADLTYIYSTFINQNRETLKK